MIEHMAEEGQYVEITGFRNVEVKNAEELLRAVRAGKRTTVQVQFFNAGLVATWEHLYFALLNALTGFRTKRNVSKSLAVEIMLYASAQRQIRKAIEFIGVKAGCSDVAVVVIGETSGDVEASVSAASTLLDKEPDERVLELSTMKALAIRKAFMITEEELTVVTKEGDAERALVDMVIERMALLSTKL
jgi:tRNA threonylcarbamoyladenosine modification (KEOPS) complex Cgi121 subunit